MDDEWTPSFRLEIGTDDEEQVAITIQAKTDGDWWGVDTVYGDNLTEALNNARKAIVAHTG